MTFWIVSRRDNVLAEVKAGLTKLFPDAQIVSCLYSCEFDELMCSNSLPDFIVTDHTIRNWVKRPDEYVCNSYRDTIMSFAKDHGLWVISLPSFHYWPAVLRFQIKAVIWLKKKAARFQQMQKKPINR